MKTFAPTHYEVEGYLDALLDDDPWASCPEDPVEDWQYEVADGDTRQGYRSWLYNKFMNED